MTALVSHNISNMWLCENNPKMYSVRKKTLKLNTINIPACCHANIYYSWNKAQTVEYLEYNILLFVPISEWILLMVIPLSFFTAKEQPNLAFSSNKNRLNTDFLYHLLKHCAERIHISFFSSAETWPWESHAATAVERSTAGWHLSSATAELKGSVPNSKLCIKQTNKKPSKNARKGVWRASTFEEMQCIFSSPSEKICIKHHVNCALSSAEISLHCNVKNVRQQFWLN